MAERFFMNKAFGKGLEAARRLDEDRKERERPGSLKRATIEPDHEHGGHKVIVERHTTVIAGRPGEGENSGRSEHSFQHADEASKFLTSLLHGAMPGEEDHGMRERPDEGDGKDETGGKPEDQGSAGADDGDGDEGGDNFLAGILNAGRGGRGGR